MTGGAGRARGSQRSIATIAAHRLAPLLLGVPVLVGVAVTLARLLTSSHPDIGYATTPNSDAEVLFLGHTIYQDPDDGYTGQLYTPLFPALVSLFHHVRLWNGWPITLSMAATLVLVGLVAALAYPPGGRTKSDRWLWMAGAVGVGAVAWWLVSALGLNLLYEGRADHVAWAFALVGLVMLARGGRRVTVVSVLLLSAAFWAKQNTLVVAVACALWMLAGAALGAWDWRRALSFCAALLALNLAILGLLSLVTGGWAFYFVFELGLNHPKVSTFGDYAREGVRAVGFGFVLALLVGAGVLVEARRAGQRRRIARVLAGSFDARLVSLLALFAVLGFPAAVYFRTQLGGDTNQYIGLAWVMGILVAVAYRRAAARDWTALVAAGALALAFVVAVAPGGKVAGLNVAEAGQDREFAELPAPWLDYARSHVMYEQVHADLNVEPQGVVYPNLYNFADLLSVGRQPFYLVNALLDRRFDAVKPIGFASPQELLFWEIYASGNGREESSYIWKLNQVIDSGYAPAPGLPEGFLARRPGPPRDPWMRMCFGPFDVGALEFEIRDGGGFWCRDGEGAVVLRRTPAPVTELHATEKVSGLAGSLGVTLPRGRFELRLSGEGGELWKLRGARTPGGVRLGGVRVPVRAGGRLIVDFKGGGAIEASGPRVSVPVPDVGDAHLSIYATRGSGARFELADLRSSG